MAPRKEKTEKASADQGSAMIVDYLKKQKFVNLRALSDYDVTDFAL